MFYKKNSKVELHSSKSLFWWSCSNFDIFSCKACSYFYFGPMILYLVLWIQIHKETQIEKNVKYKISIVCIIDFDFEEL